MITPHSIIGESVYELQLGNFWETFLMAVSNSYATLLGSRLGSALLSSSQPILQDSSLRADEGTSGAF